MSLKMPIQCVLVSIDIEKLRIFLKFELNFDFKDLIVEMLTVLAGYNITVEELKAIFHKLKGTDKQWVSLKIICLFF